MEKTPEGTSVGVDDPYAVVERCDHLTDDGRCRYAAEYGHRAPEFAEKRRADDLRCPVVDPDGEAQFASGDASGKPTDRRSGEWGWADCPQFRAREHSTECVRCGLEEVRMAHSRKRPLIEEHHLEYPDDDRRELAHEITVSLCRWCHAMVHRSWGRIDDDVAPGPEAIAEAESRRADEHAEFEFESAAERYDN